MTYHLREALLAMRGNFTATLSTLTTMTLTLLMLGFVLLLTLNVNRTLEQLESQVEVAAFLSANADVLVAAGARGFNLRRSGLVDCSVQLVLGS